MNNQNSEPAFPQIHNPAATGMTLRDYFAGQFMANPEVYSISPNESDDSDGTESEDDNLRGFVTYCFKAADIAIAARANG